MRSRLVTITIALLMFGIGYLIGLRTNAVKLEECQRMSSAMHPYMRQAIFRALEAEAKLDKCKQGLR